MMKSEELSILNDGYTKPTEERLREAASGIVETLRHFADLIEAHGLQEMPLEFSWRSDLEIDKAKQAAFPDHPYPFYRRSGAISISLSVKLHPWSIE